MSLQKKERLRPKKNTEYEQFIGRLDNIHNKFVVKKHIIHKKQNVKNNKK